MKHLALAFFLGLVGTIGVSHAQDSEEAGRDAETSGNQVRVSEASGVPFTARLSIDSVMPIIYGDDVVISILISALEGIDISAVRIRPKGVLGALYQDETVESSEGEETRTQGVDCPIGRGSLLEGRSIIINCRLNGKAIGWQRWLDWNALLDARSAQMQVVIELRNGREDTAQYYEYISADFVSPKAHVILGGFFGAALWALFLTLPVTAMAAASVEPFGWRGVVNKALRSLPEIIVKFGVVGGVVLQRALLGGFTALVIIVVAKGTEGLEPPISVHIQDFWGGMMIGILSTPLAKRLREKFSTV